MKTAEITKATDDFDAVRTIVVVLEQFKKEDQERILRWTIEKIGLNVSMSLSHLNRDTTGTSEIRSKENIASVAPKLGCDIKSFVAKKNPLNDTQFAAVLAYYHMFEAPEKKDAISQQDLLDACRLAGRKRPGIPRITLNNAKLSGYLDSAGSGLYKINSVGENLVAMTLPQSATSNKPKIRLKHLRRQKSKTKKK